MKSYSVFVILWIVFAAGCATTSRVFEKQRFRRVGVVAVVGPKCGVKLVGSTMFGNKEGFSDTGNLAIADFLRDETVSALNEVGFEAQPIKVAAADWFERYDAKQNGGLTGFLSAYGADVATSLFRKELADLIGRDQLDGIVVFIPGRDTVNQSGEAWVCVGDTGYGFVARSDAEIEPYVLGQLYWFDGANSTTVRTVRVQAWGAPIKVPFRREYREFSSVEREQLEESLYSGFRDEIRRVLRTL